MDDLEQSMSAFPSNGPLVESRSPDKKSEQGCYRHFSGDCVEGTKCIYSHSEAAMRKIALDRLGSVGRHQHITLEEAHKALDSSATKKHPDTGLPKVDLQSNQVTTLPGFIKK